MQLSWPPPLAELYITSGSRLGAEAVSDSTMRHESDPPNIHEDMNRCAGHYFHTRARSNAIFRSKQHDSVYGRGLGILRSGILSHDT